MSGRLPGAEERVTDRITDPTAESLSLGVP